MMKRTMSTAMTTAVMATVRPAMCELLSAAAEETALEELPSAMSMDASYRVAAWRLESSEDSD